jgi:hypothetical protein
MLQELGGDLHYYGASRTVLDLGFPYTSNDNSNPIVQAGRFFLCYHLSLPVVLFSDCDCASRSISSTTEPH